jgi:hypothetical protein
MKSFIASYLLLAQKVNHETKNCPKNKTIQRPAIMLQKQADISGPYKDRPAAGRRSRPKKQKPHGAAAGIACDFLKQTFLPVTDRQLPKVHKCRELQQSFFKSLENLNKLYGLKMVDAETTVFPGNIMFAYDYAAKQLSEKDSSLKLFIVEKEGLPVICTGKTLSTGYTLYYISLYPLHQFLQDYNKRPIADLLLSAFAYLHLAGVPLCDESSYVGYEMQIIQEYVIESPGDWEPEDFSVTAEQMETIIRLCKKISKRISSKNNLRLFSQRLKKANASNLQETNLIEAIKDIHELYKIYPDRKFLDKIPRDFLNHDRDDTIYMEQYVSFYWGSQTWFDDQLGETINIQLQEKSATEEPIALQLFDTSQDQPCHDLTFEKLFLEKITHLNNALYAF